MIKLMKSSKIIKSYYQDISLKKQLQIAFLSFFIFMLLITLFMFSIWRTAYTTQIQANVYKDLATISKNNTDRLSQIEDLSYQVIDNQFIQDQILEIENASNKEPRYQILLKDRLGKEINDIIRNTSFVKEAYLFNTDGTNLINFIANKEQIIAGYSSNEVITKLPDTPSPGVWTFNENISQGVYARKIFSTVNLSLEYIGTIIFLVDTSFFHLDQQKIPIIDENSLFFLEYRTNWFAPESDTNTLQKFQREISKSDFNKKRVFGSFHFNKQNYYIAMDHYQHFNFYYLIPDNKIMSSLYHLYSKLLLISLPLLAILILFIQKIAHQLTFPLQKLTNQMLEIQHTKDIESLRKIPILDPRATEISILYNSYNLMIDEINHLINDNFKMKILSQEIEFKNLQTQLDPHFLYNTLDSINWIAIANNQEQISEMVTSLAYLFRKKIDIESDFTTLADELDIINAYIRIQKVRFGQRIEYFELILVDDLTIEIPKLLIQPLIENIFKHAVTHMKNTCQIVLSIEFSSVALHIKVSDNGPGVKTSFSIEENQGIGLKNIKKRLSLYYDTQATLFVSKSIPFKKTIFEISIPIQYLKKANNI